MDDQKRNNLSVGVYVNVKVYLPCDVLILVLLRASVEKKCSMKSYIKKKRKKEKNKAKKKKKTKNVWFRLNTFYLFIFSKSNPSNLFIQYFYIYWQNHCHMQWMEEINLRVSILKLKKAVEPDFFSLKIRLRKRKKICLEEPLLSK